MDAVAVDADLDAVIDDRPERRADDDLRIASTSPSGTRPSARRSRAPSAVSSRSGVTTGTWCTIQRRPVMSNSLLTASYASTTCVRPARFCTLFSLRQPACADQPLRLAPDRAAPERRRPFADRAGHHHVVAEELELVPQPLLQLRQRRIVLVLQEVHLQPDDRLALRGAARARSRTCGTDRGSTGSGSDAAAPASGTAPDRDARSARRWPSRPSRRACCASCPRTSAAGAGGRARSPTDRRRQSRPRRSRRCRRRSPARYSDAPAAPRRRRRRTSCRGCWSRTDR